MLFALSDNVELNEVKVEIKQLKKQIEEHHEFLDEHFLIIEENEKRTILDKLNLSPELEVRTDKFDYRVGDIEGETTKIVDKENPFYNQTRRTNYTKNFDMAGYIRFRLNMHGKLDETISFHGRLIFAHSTQSYQRLCILSRDIKSNFSSSDFDVEHAYFDYSTNKMSEYATTFTFGLLPTTGGTPMQFAQNSKRQSMFPALVFDMNTFGVIVTQKLSKSTFIRAIHARAYTLGETFYPYQCNRENIDNATITGLYSDTSFSLLGEGLLSYGLNMIEDLKAHPYLGPDVSAENASVLGDIYTLGVGIDVKNVLDTPITLFLHAALSLPDANGNRDDYQMSSDSDSGFSTADYAQGAMLSNRGYALYAGFNYAVTQSVKVGVEYNYGSKYWFSATQGAEDMYNKLATRGDVKELYGTWNFHKNIYAKLAYLYTNENFTGSGWHFGKPAAKDGEQNVVYLSINAKF